MILEELNQAGIGFKAGAKKFDSSRPTLLMIHGAGGRSQVWLNQIYPLESSLNTLAIDLPGHGNTVEGAKKSVAAYAAWLMETLEAFFPEKPFLMGHSMGGAIVQEAAVTNPSLMKGIILAATGPVLKVAPAFLEGLLNNFENTVDTIMGYAYGPEADRRLLMEGAAFMKEAGPAVVHGDFLACHEFDMRDRLPQLLLPARMVCGEKDQLTPPALSRKLKNLIPESDCVIIPSAGHMVMIEAYKDFNETVLDFVSGR